MFIKPFCSTKNRQGAYVAVELQATGQAASDLKQMKAYSATQNLRYTGTPQFSFTHYIQGSQQPGD